MRRCQFTPFNFARCFVLAGLLLIAPSTWAQGWPAARLAPYVPSPTDVAERMLQMAHVAKNDTVYDLGAGDGRIVVLAARKFGAKAVGVEIDKDLCNKAEDNIKRASVEDKARMECEDFMDVDLSDATVVTLYLTTVANGKLRPHLEKYLHKGTRVVSHAFEIPGWKPAKIETWRGPGTRHDIYLYIR